MNLEVHGHQLEVTDALRTYANEKFQRLCRHFEHPFDSRIQLSIDKPHHCAEGTVTANGRTLHAEASAPTMYAAIDILVDKLDRSLQKVKDRMVDHGRGDSVRQQL
ncbi:ribosome hibernation-promoting factor, HPF/YfiA family [Solilutibacter silvestris]|uniref:Ribosome hibernation promoting factor n=1 Tax=Solilutibacter silvestris TaxID=1645665 RepID=A0A2K1Q2V1_9GAMM|nr:ribosome-associated translation inhibitor RaiA [Lysobacter silvestris]PNS09372.1 yfiA: ribosomal subunit interface protein [Lysobacter silvestris]